MHSPPTPKHNGRGRRGRKAKAGAGGLEPPTSRLTAGRSAIDLHPKGEINLRQRQPGVNRPSSPNNPRHPRSIPSSSSLIVCVAECPSAPSWGWIRTAASPRTQRCQRTSAVVCGRGIPRFGLVGPRHALITPVCHDRHWRARSHSYDDERNGCNAGIIQRWRCRRTTSCTPGKHDRRPT